MTKIIAAFDVATATGVCVGPVGGKPQVVTWDLREAGPSRAMRLWELFKLLEAFFIRWRPDLVVYEAPMPIAVANKIGASEETMLLLRGAVGVLEMAAARAGIREIRSFSVRDARKHLTGSSSHGKDKKGKSLGKLEAVKVAKMLGVNVQDDNQADAYAGWSYECALQNPRLAHLVTPLFAGG